MKSERSRFYAVSTGAGNPENLTLEAIRALKSCGVIFYPQSEKNTIALDTISQTCEIGLSQKTLVPCRFSMTREEEKRAAEYEKISSDCEDFLKSGKSAAFLSIGDVSLYSTAARLARKIKSHGFEVKFISGVNSFSAAACSAQISLAERDEKITVIPADAFFASGKLKSALKDEGTKILMKMARHLKEIISLLNEENLIQNAVLAQKVSLPDEKIFKAEEILNLNEEDFKNAYLSVMIIKTEK